LTNEIKCKDELSNLYEKKIEGLEREISNSSEYIFEIDRLKKTVSDIDALKQRIMIVENQIR
jgi:Tfp pilus assembly protein PilN